MHIPSERIRNEMYSATASIWYVPATGDGKFAILIKSLTSSIKAIISGCPIELIFGIDGSYLCKGIRIHDMPDSPIVFSDVQRHQEEHRALYDILNAKKTAVFIYNEMDICLAWTYAHLPNESLRLFTNFAGSIDSLYKGEWTGNESKILDNFVYSTDQSKQFSNAHVIDFIEIVPVLEKWRISNNSFIGIRESHSVVIDDRNEGEVFERVIWSALESIFPFSIYKSPQVIIGNKKRELTDIFSYYNNASFLIEAKDLSVLNSGFDRNQDRKTKGVQKQINKALQQLIGAVKALERNESIYDNEGCLVNVDNAIPIHCIVLVTEIMEYGDWTETQKKMVETMAVTKAFLNVMDFREFITIIKGCQGKIELIDLNLRNRAMFFIDKKTIHIRSLPEKH